MRLVLSSLLLLLFSDLALAFPSNTRYGYSSCGTCHVSPTGGGTLTPYGRMTSEEFLSTWSTAGEAQTTYGVVEEPSWIALGGDTRYLFTGRGSPRSDFTSRDFLMQSDVELVLRPSKKLTVVASGGVYGPQEEPQFRRNYLKFKLDSNFTFRAGKFFPAYGVLLPDHTAVTRNRLGFGQGGETYNLEASYTSQYGELFLTRTYGRENFVALTKDKGYLVEKEKTEGVTARAAYYLGKSSQIGFSYLYEENPTQARIAAGPYMLWGMTDDLYGVFELDRVFNDRQIESYYFYGKLGWEFLRGIHLLGNYQLEKNNQELEAHTVGGGLQWFPRPHWEFMARAQRRLVEDTYSDSVTLLFHYYL